MAIAPPNRIIRELTEAGIIPLECRSFELIIKPGEAVIARSEVFVTEDQFRTIAGAMAAHRQEITTETTVFSASRGDSEGIELNDITTICDEFQRFAPKQ